MKKPLLPVLFVLLPVFALAAEVNLALNRPVRASSTDHAPTQAEFAVDGETLTGWRARFFTDWARTSDPVKTLPQWIEVDLQGDCRVSSVRFFSEADSSTGEFVKNRRLTIGHEIYSTYPTSYRIEGSATGASWTVLAERRGAKGGWQQVELPAGSVCRYIRVLIEDCSGILPVGINELEVYGTCDAARPQTWGWKERRKAKTAVDKSLDLRSPAEIGMTTGWEMTCHGWYGATDGAQVSRPGFDTQNWYNASVPGTVVTTLVNEGVFPDPVVGLNNLRIPEYLCKTNWWYRRAFTLPAGFEAGAGRRVMLEFDKINHHANIWVNGKKVDEIDYCFVQRSIDVTALLTAGENVVAVEICPMKLVGVPGDKSEEGDGWVNSRVISRGSPTYICSSGWDWMPAMRDRGIGILEEVRLRSTGTVTIGDAHVQTDLDLPDTTKAYVYIDVPVKNGTDKAQKATVAATFEGVAVSAAVEVPAGQTVTVKFTPAEYPALKLRKPRLWWPNGYGQANLYDLKITARTGEGLSDSYQTKFGVRKVTYNIPLVTPRRGTHMIEPTTARYVRLWLEESVHGVFGLCDFSVYDSRNVSDDLAAWKKTFVSSNQGGEHSSDFLTDVRGVSKWYSKGGKDEWATVDLGEPKRFDMVIAGWHSPGLASKYKVQVSDNNKTWRDVATGGEQPGTQLEVSVNGVRIFCKGGNWGLYELALRMPRERMENCLRMHCDSKMNMIRTWMGNFFDRDFFECCDKYGVLVFSDLWGGMPDDEPRYIEICRENIVRFRNHPCVALWCASNETYPSIPIDRGIRDAVVQLDSTRLYLSHSADNHVDGGGGIYFYVPEKHYYEIAHGFKTEIGLPTVPVYETMLRMGGGDQIWPIGDTWYYHDYFAREANARYVAAFEGMLGKAKDLEDYCRKAQFIHYQNTRAMFEAWNANLWEKGCGGLLLWMSNPAWYSTVWQTYDYDLEVNGTWAGAKKGCESLHIQCSPEDWGVCVSNTTSRPVRGMTATVKVFDINGKQWGRTQTQKVDVPASDKKHLWPVEFAADVPTLHFVWMQLSDAKGKAVSENFYWKFGKPADMLALNDAKATLKATASAPYVKDGRTCIDVRLSNTGNVVASMVRLSLKDKASGERILPTFYSDNYVWVLPGHERTLTVDCAAKDTSGLHPTVAVSGYNVDEFYTAN